MLVGLTLAAGAATVGGATFGLQGATWGFFGGCAVLGFYFMLAGQGSSVERDAEPPLPGDWDGDGDPDFDID